MRQPKVGDYVAFKRGDYLGHGRVVRIGRNCVIEIKLRGGNRLIVKENITRIYKGR